MKINIICFFMSMFLNSFLYIQEPVKPPVKQETKPEIIKMADEDTAIYKQFAQATRMDTLAAEAAYQRARATQAGFENFMLKMEKKYKVNELWDLKGEDKLAPYWEKRSGN